MADGVLQLQGVRVIDERLAATVYGHCYSTTTLVTLIAVDKEGTEKSCEIEADSDFEMLLPVGVEYKFYTEINSVRELINDEWKLLTLGKFRQDIHTDFATVFYTEEGVDKYVICSNQEDINSLCTSDAYTSSITVKGVSFVKNSVTGVYVNKTSEIPDNFLRNFISMTWLHLNVDSTITSIGDYFLGNCRALEMDVLDLSKTSITEIKNYFLVDCVSFNGDIYLPAACDTIGTNFLLGCVNFDKPIPNMPNLKFIGDFFLQNCNLFNKRVNLESLESLGTYFLAGCSQLNQQVLVGSRSHRIKQIPDRFMYNCKSFIKAGITIYPILFSSEDPENTQFIIGNDFLYGCDMFNGSVIFDSYNGTYHTRSIGNNFMENCISLVTAPVVRVTEIGNNFMRGCTSLTKVTWFIGRSVLPTTKIGSYFLADCPNLTSIEVSTFPPSSYTDPATLEIGEGFLYNSLGSTVYKDLFKFECPPPRYYENIQIGKDFLKKCTRLNCPLNFSEKITSVGRGFMAEMNNFINEIQINFDPTSSQQNLQYSLYSTDARQLSVLHGIKISGTYANQFKQLVPNTNTRNLV